MIEEVRIPMDVWSTAPYPAGALSNFASHAFVFDYVQCVSMESLLQSFKVTDPVEQVALCQLRPSRAKSQGRLRDWRIEQLLWWDGQCYSRTGEAYQNLLDRAYGALATNPEFAAALLGSGDANLTHERGQDDPALTVLTRAEFCGRLLDLREGLRSGRPRSGGARFTRCPDDS